MRTIGLVIGGLLFTFGTALWAQTGIFGVVRDSSGRLLQGADVQVQSESTGVIRKTQSDENGDYCLAGLPPGHYKVTARLPGFRTVSRVGAAVDPQSDLSLDFAMDLLVLHEVITVVSGNDQVDPSKSGSLLLARRNIGATLPSNGPDYRMIFDLMPGVVITPAGVNDGGQFTSNGQRPNANSFRVDGVSANTGVGGSTLPGSFPGASLPAMSAIGSTENLGSSETTESVELRTSVFAPESGSRLGAQAIVTTRSGSNEFRGEFFGHLRDTSWNARDWFANSYGIPYTRPSYRKLGGVLGGPVFRNRTFFFLSVENSRLKDSGLERTPVPSSAARQNAPPALQRVLDAFPPPTGPDLAPGESEGMIGLGRTASLQSYSARVDQALGSWGNLFARYVRSPSSSSSSQMDAIEGVSDWRSVTIGITMDRPKMIHEIRLNYSGAAFRSTYTNSPWVSAFSLAGLWPTTPSGWDSINSLLPVSSATATVWGVSIPDLGQFIFGDYGKSTQDQWQYTEFLTAQTGRHQFRAGFDYMGLKPSRNTPLTSVLGKASSLEGLLNGDPVAIDVSQLPQYSRNVRMMSFFAQDTFRVTDGFGIVYGFRWELTPPLESRIQVATVSGLWSGTKWTTTSAGNVNGAAPWPMRYGQFAPRIGLAYRLPGGGLVIRAGAGAFYDSTLGAAVDPVNGAPFNSWLLPAGATGINRFGNAPTGSESQTGMASDVHQFLFGPYPALHLPVSYQWRFSVEKGVGPRGVGSVAYIGSASRHLIGNQIYIEPSTGSLDRGVTLTENPSSYNALQARYSGPLSRSVFVSTSYTWSHCIDDGSEDSSIFLIHPGYRLSEARGSCNFDIRQMFTGAFSYRIPRSTLPAAASGWMISGVFRARSGFPLNVLSGEQTLGQQFANAGRPDVVPGVPVWIPDPSVPGHRRLNRAAFALPVAGRQGTLGRNVIVGNGLAQLDVSVRREFEIIRGTSLEIGLNIFNVLNHPAFADPIPFLSNPLFGQSTSMQNLMLGSGTPNTGLPQLFQTGGSRSAELSFRLCF